MRIFALLLLGACSSSASPIADAAIAADAAPDASSAEDAGLCPCGDGGACAPNIEVCLANTHDHPGIGVHTEYLCSPLPAECTPTSDCACVTSSFCTCTTGPACWTVACTAP